MAIWPSELPQMPQKQGYSEKPANNSIRSKMEVGPAKSRRRISAGVRDHKFLFLVNFAQIEIFAEFYDATLLSGSLSYLWNHPRTGVEGLWRISKLPEWTPVDDEYLSLSLEVELLP